MSKGAKYLRRLGSFEHTPISEPGLYDIRSYDPDDVELAAEDGIPFDQVEPTSTYQIWVTDAPGLDLVYSRYPDNGSDACYPVENLWEEEWYTRRLVARPGDIA